MDDKQLAKDAQCSVFSEALVIYEDRYEVRGDLWQEADQPEDLIRHMENKLLRAKSALKAHPGKSNEAVRLEAEDSLLDLINYAAFALRWARAPMPRPGGLAGFAADPDRTWGDSV